MSNFTKTNQASYKLYKNDLNIFKYGYLPWTYPSNILHNIGQFFRNIKYAFQRCKYGFSDFDTWNFDYYLTVVIANGLNVLNANRHGYPAQLTNEQWGEILEEISAHLYNSIEDNPNVALANACNEAYDKMCSYILKTELLECEGGKYSAMKETYSDEEAYNKAKEEWRNLILVYGKYMTQEKRKGLEMLTEHINGLWD